MNPPGYLFLTVGHLLGKIHGIMRRFTGFTFHFPGVRAKFTINGGKILVNGRPMKLIPSTNARFPKAQGWGMVKFMGWTYFIKFGSRGVQVQAMHNGRIVHGVVSGEFENEMPISSVNR